MNLKTYGKPIKKELLFLSVSLRNILMNSKSSRVVVVAIKILTLIKLVIVIQMWFKSHSKGFKIASKKF